MKTKLLMIQGTSSGAGKSLIVTALCRILSDKGYRVAPFKSQNMSSFIFNINNTDKIIAQAQAIQAIGARIKPDVRMNPILLKPTGNYESEVYLYGNFYLKMKANEYYTNFVLNQGFKLVLDAFKSLKKDNEVIILEGAGSPAEINILKYDIANMLLAKEIKAPVILVADIERGGSFASILGTITLLKPNYSKLIKGILLNKFLGDKHILFPAIKKIEKHTKKPFLGIIPKIDHNIPSEDSLDSKMDRITNNISNNSKELNSEIDKFSKIIETVIDIEYILRKILKEMILITCFSISFDYFIGEPPNAIHPVVWIGKIIKFSIRKIKKRNNKKQRINERIRGSILAICLTTISGIFTYLIILQSFYIIETITFILLSTFILKSTFAIKSMDKHIKDILNDIEKKEIEKARYNLSKIVSRKTYYQHV